MHYYQFNIGDYRKDTGHLSTLEHGIYRQLLDWYYLDEQPIPKETQSVLRRLRLGSESDALALQNVLNDFFVLKSDGYHQLRCDMEIKDYHHKVDVNKANGKLGGRPKKTQSVILANPTESEAKANETLTSNHKPITNNHKPKNKVQAVVQRPDSVSQQVWDDWLSVRKKKGAASLSQTAWDKIVSEVQISGWTFEDAISECCLRNWIGFKAEWVADKQVSSRTTQISFAQQERELGWKRWEEMTGREHPDRLAHEGKRPNQFIEVQATDILEIGK
jgi:uncharacterized protein YdaU (DUF1376 family)